MNRKRIVLLLHEKHAVPWGDFLAAEFPNVDLVVQRSRGAFDGDPSRADVYLVPPFLKAAIAPALASAPRVRWVHTSAAGVDHIPLDLLKERRVVLTNGRTVHTLPVAEGAVALLLALAKGLPESRDDQHARRWHPRPIVEIAGSTVGILGTGDIGRALAKRLVSLGAACVGCSRSGRARRPFARVFPVARLRDFLAASDHLIVTTPSTDETRGLLGGGALTPLRNGALFVNVGRGSVIGEPDLLEALDSGLLAGAALDVFETEPLPEASALWSHPRVLVTPHDIDMSRKTSGRSRALFAENLKRFRQGRPLRNRVSYAKGY